MGNLCTVCTPQKYIPKTQSNCSICVTFSFNSYDDKYFVEFVFFSDVTSMKGARNKENFKYLLFIYIYLLIQQRDGKDRKEERRIKRWREKGEEKMN